MSSTTRHRVRTVEEEPPRSSALQPPSLKCCSSGTWLTTLLSGTPPSRRRRSLEDRPNGMTMPRTRGGRSASERSASQTGAFGLSSGMYRLPRRLLSVGSNGSLSRSSLPLAGPTQPPSCPRSGPPKGDQRQSEVDLQGLEAGAGERRAGLALVHAAVDELAAQPGRGQVAAAPATERERLLERGIAPRAGLQLHGPDPLDAGVGQGVDVALAVVPLDVVLLAGLERGLVHLGLAELQHVLEVLLEEVPVVVVVRAAIGTGDHDAAHALRLEHDPHVGEVLEVGLDVLSFAGVERARLLVVVAVAAAAAGRRGVVGVEVVGLEVVGVHQPCSVLSSADRFRSANENVRNPSANSIPAAVPSSAARRRTHSS